MAPLTALGARDLDEAEIVQQRGRASLTLDGVIVEAWAEGYQVGSLIILILLVICNYRRHVPLHKLIVLEMILALWHGTFIFFPDPIYGWYLSSTACLLFLSYNLHNVIAYLKIRVFLPRWGRWVFVITLALVQPFWVVETWDNFMYFNRGTITNTYTRPWEALFRDPWWIFTLVWLLYQISNRYQFSIATLVKVSPRFGVMIFCMVLSIIFMVVDVTVTARSVFADSGVNPFWRLTLVFKCAADTIFLDDFKSVLDKIIDRRFNNIRRTSDMPTSDMPSVIRSRNGSDGERRKGSSASASAPSGKHRRPSFFDRQRKASRDRAGIDDTPVSPRAGGFRHIETALPSIPDSASRTAPPPHPSYYEKRDRAPNVETASDGSRIPLNHLTPHGEAPSEQYYFEAK